MTADQVAQEAQFFSFGTNDLTQLTFGYSRDDVGKFLRVYQRRRSSTRIRSRRSTSRASAPSFAPA
jgi:phosphoenolpyruvate synthase/pyruvate phosphate dikinase